MSLGTVLLSNALITRRCYPDTTLLIDVRNVSHKEGEFEIGEENPKDKKQINRGSLLAQPFKNSKLLSLTR